MADAHVAGDDAPTAVRTVRPEFTGTAREYFRIWIVNLFFSIVTLGIYSAWAKVRKKKYFYGSTRLDGDSFDYFARPEAILKGRVVAFVVFVIYALSGELYPESRFAFLVLAALVMPWLVVRALTFNARNSAHRGLRFHFNGTAKRAAAVYIGMPLAAALTLGFAYPWFVARQKAFVLSHHLFGTTQIECELSAGKVFGIYVRAFLIVVILVVPTTLIVFMGTGAYSLSHGHGNLEGWFVHTVETAFTAILYLSIYAVSYAYVQSHVANLMWNSTHGPGFRFSSSLHAGRVFWLYVGNIVAVACSAGLLIPWAVVRTLKYRIECLSLTIEKAVVHEANPDFALVGATGQELGDFFNLDLGL